MARVESAQSIREEFADLARRPDAELGPDDLERGAILIAAEEYPELEAAAVCGALTELAALARARLAEVPQGAPQVERMNRFLFGEQRFTGAAEYYDPRNSYLNEVIVRRTGIPITLALVYIGVGRRAGLDVRGISFPGHFLVRCCAGPEEQLIDAFHGRVVTPSECAARLAAEVGPEVDLRPEIHLRDATPREILVRMLGNLQRIFAEQGDMDRLLGCCDRLVLLAPRDPIALHDRALVYQTLGWYAPAIADLDAALAHAAEKSLVSALRQRRDALRQRLGPLH
jgi:regulator of sirC expression with transglutaminase-like and TPR domain